MSSTWTRIAQNVQSAAQQVGDTVEAAYTPDNAPSLPNNSDDAEEARLEAERQATLERNRQAREARRQQAALDARRRRVEALQREAQKQKQMEADRKRAEGSSDVVSSDAFAPHGSPMANKITTAKTKAAAAQVEAAKERRSPSARAIAQDNAKGSQKNDPNAPYNKVLTAGLTSADIVGVDDLLMSQVSTSLQQNAQLGVFKPNQAPIFRDANGSAIGPKGVPYTLADFHAAEKQAASGGGAMTLTIDPSSIRGPLFEKKGTSRGIGLTDADLQFIAQGGDSRGLPKDAIPTDPDKSSSVLDWIKEIAGWARNDPDQLAAFQQKLYDAGWYDTVGDAEYKPPLDPKSSKAFKGPQLGTLDKDTIDAMSSFTEYAMGFGYTLDKDVWELLSDQAKARSEQRARVMGGSDGGGGGGGGSATPIPTTDEAQVRQLGDSVGQEVLGRRLTLNESQQVFDLVHSMESAEGVAREEGGVYQTTDPEAEIRKWIREHNPVDAAAHDTAGTFDMFASILQSGLGLGQGASFGKSLVGAAGTAGVGAASSGVIGPASSGAI